MKIRRDTNRRVALLAKIQVGVQDGGHDLNTSIFRLLGSIPMFFCMLNSNKMIKNKLTQ